MSEPGQFSLEVNGVAVEVVDDGATLLDVLREQVGVTSAKDGCSPQGQCGCCTVLVDGAPRVACVTPARRVRDRAIVTVEGLPDADRNRWAEAFTATGASQCGFCTPGIMVRLHGLVDRRDEGDVVDESDIERSLQAHLCRCTGWQTIVEAAVRITTSADTAPAASRDLDAAADRAELEGGRAQLVGDAVALGAGGFAADEAPTDALVAVPAQDGSWFVGETLREARSAAGKVQGRRTTIDPAPPIAVPDGDWVRRLQTGWVEPGYLETDSSWCEPGGEPASALGNGGAFGGKEQSLVGAAARSLADEHDRAVRIHLSREDSVRMGHKRPPLAAGIDAAGRVSIRVARTEGIRDRLLAGLAAHGVDPARVAIEEVDVLGPPTSVALRSAGYAEGAVIGLAASGVGDGMPHRVVGADGGWAEVEISDDGVVVRVDAGAVLDDVVLRSYCIGAVHMGLGWVTSENIAVDDDGVVHDLTIRSFGILRAIDTPQISVLVDGATGPAVNVSDAVFAATASAIWATQGHPPSWPSAVPAAR